MMLAALRSAWHRFAAKAAKPVLTMRVQAPKTIIDTARARGVMLPEVYYGQAQGLARQLAFSIAGVNSLDQLQLVKDSLDDAFAKGESFEAWRKRVMRGEVPLNLPKHRLETIFRTNLQAVYSRGNGEHIRRNLHVFPYLLYSAVNDSRTRPAHRAMHGTILPTLDPWWATHRPPNGYNCRCRAIALTEADAKKRGVTAVPPTDAPDPGWDYDPWADPKRGMLVALQKRRMKLAPKLAAKVDDVMTAAKMAGTELDPDTWKLVGPQRGSNMGGVYEAANGAKFYAKFYADADQARTEVATLALYRAAGLETLESRIVEMVAPDGKRRVGIATRWRDDLQPLGTAADTAELARAYQVSAMVGNWDVTGPDLANIGLTKAGRVIILDAGGSMRFRAQGKPKPFAGDDVPEFATLRDPLINRTAATVFNRALDADVFGESAAARAVADALTPDAIDRALGDAAFGRDMTDALRATLIGRRGVMIDRYDLDGRYMPEGARGHFDELVAMMPGKRWETDAQHAGGHRYSTAMTAEAPKMVEGFEAWVNSRFPQFTKGTRHTATSLLRAMFVEWSGSSSAGASAVMKQWAESRFKRHGAAYGFHRDTAGARGRKLVETDADNWLTQRNLARDDVFALLDAEYAFNQYLLRRGHGWSRITLHRWMPQSEFNASAADGKFRGNSVASYTVNSQGFHGHVRLGFSQWRTEFVMKVWQQGAKYLTFQNREAEYLGIGGLFEFSKDY